MSGTAATGALGSFGAFNAFGDAMTGKTGSISSGGSSGGISGGDVTGLVSSALGFGTSIANAVATGRAGRDQIAAFQIQADAAAKSTKDAIKLANKQLKLARVQSASVPVPAVTGGGDTGGSSMPGWLLPVAAVVVLGGTAWVFRKKIMRAIGGR